MTSGRIVCHFEAAARRSSIVILVLGFLAATAGAAPAPDAAADVPPVAEDALPTAYLGSWTGTGDQDTPPIERPIEIELSDGRTGEVVGEVRYPSLACRGEVTLTEIRRTYVELRERITEGLGSCVDGGTFLLKATNAGTLRFLWHAPDHHSSAVGVLTPPGEDDAGSPNDAAPASIGRPALRWRFETGGSIIHAPAVVDDTAYVQSRDGFLYALDRETGVERWRIDIGDTFFDSFPVLAVAEGIAYVADEYGKLRALDVATGEERWSRVIVLSEENSRFSTPVIANDLVYVDDIDGDAGNLYALDAATGEPRWQARTTRMEAGPLLVADGIVIVSDVAGITSAFNAPSGELVWTYETGVQQGAVAASGVIFLGNDAGAIVALDADNGELIWTFAQPSDQPVYPSMTVEDGLLYIDRSSSDRLPSLLVLDAATGELRWERASSSGRTAVREGIVTVVVDAEGEGTSEVVAVDAVTGVELWRIRARPEMLPLSENLVLAVERNDLFALDAAGDRELWRVRAGGLVLGGVTVAADGLYVGSEDRVVVALDLNSDLPRPPANAAVSAPTVEPLVWAVLDSVPSTPAEVGLWRLTVAPGATVALPALPVDAVAFVSEGELIAPDGIAIADRNSSGTSPFNRNGPPRLVVNALLAGDSFFLGAEEQSTIRNDAAAPAAVLLLTILPAGSAPVISNQDGATFTRLAGGEASVLPGGTASLRLSRWTLQPGQALPPTLGWWPLTAIVESGAVRWHALDGAALFYRRGDPVATGKTRATLRADYGVFLAGGAAFSTTVSGDEPTSVLILDIGADIPSDQFAGCRGRCLRART